jgi:capsular exopolysaccharide synthesis family protein
MVSGHNAARLGWGDYLYLLSSRWPLVLLVGSLVLLGGAALKRQLPSLYEVEAHIGLGVPGPLGEPLQGRPEFERSGPSDLFREADEIRSRALLSEVVGPLALLSRWKITDEDDLMARLGSRVDVEVLHESKCLLLRARDVSPRDASALANAIGDRFVLRKDAEARAEANARVIRLEQEIAERRDEIALIEAGLVAIAEEAGPDSQDSTERRRRLVTLRNLIHSLEAKHQLALLEVDEARGTARLIAPALADRAVATMPLWLSVPGLVILGVLAGMATVLGIALSFRRSRWGVIADLLKQFQLHFAGFAPVSNSGKMAMSEGSGAFLEPYRELRNRLLRLPAGDCVWMTMIPMRRNEAGGEAIVHLAAVLADSGRTVLVIDADFRAPSLHLFFDAAHHPGLSDYLCGEMRLEETVIRTRRMNLWFMPTGPLHDDPSGLLNGKRMSDLVRELRSRFDFILVASPSINDVSDAGVLAAISEFNTLIAPYHGVSLRRLRETQLALDTVNAPLSGVLLTTRVEPVRAASRRASPTTQAKVTATR